MCGIVGLVLPEHISAKTRRRLVDGFTGALVDNERRGPVATGIATYSPESGFMTLKSAVGATQFVRGKEYSRLLQPSRGAVAMIGHTRNPTQGSPAISDNNHPIRVDRVLGVHNGWISNDREIFSSLAKDGVRRTAQVDSEALFRLVDISVNHRGTDVETLGALLYGVEGAFSFAYLNMVAPGELVVCKGDMPLTVMQHTSGAVAYSSEGWVAYTHFKPSQGWMEVPVAEGTLIVLQAGAEVTMTAHAFEMPPSYWEQYVGGTSNLRAITSGTAVGTDGTRGSLLWDEWGIDGVDPLADYYGWGERDAQLGR